MQKPQFTEDNIYHIYNRGVEKRQIFMDKSDYFRFIHDLYEFNDADPVENINYYFNPQSDENHIEVRPRYAKEKKKRKLLVEILAFVAMPNHFHLLMKQVKNNGIVHFMQKIGTGYTMYFNKKNNRVGGLFQGSFKAILIKDDAHLFHLPFYIHANPIEIYKGRPSIENHLNFLKNYRWSSYLDYVGIKNFPSITSRGFLTFYTDMDKEGDNVTSMKDYLKNSNEYLEKLNGVTIDHE